MRISRNAVAITIGAAVLAVMSLLGGAGQAAADADANSSFDCEFNWDGRSECFWVGTADGGVSVPGVVYHRWQYVPGGAFGPAYTLGGWATSGIDVERNGDGRLEVFVRAGGGDLSHRWQVTAGGAWNSDWHSLGGFIDPGTGPFNAGPHANLIDNQLHVLVWGPDNRWHHNYQRWPGGPWLDEWE